MMSTERAFEDLGIDVVSATEIMGWLDLSRIDLGDPQRFSRLQSVINYFKQFPVETQRFLIRKALSGKVVDKLTHIWEYSELLKNKRAVEERMETLKREGSALGSDSDPFILKAHAERELSVRDELNRLQDEISLYEK